MHDFPPTVIPTGTTPCTCAPAIDRPDAPRGGFTAREPALPSAVRSIRRRLRTWVAGASDDEDVREAVIQLTDEAVTNAVEHATAERPCTVDVLANIRGCGGGLAVLVHDDGTWRPPPTDRGFRGRGVAMIGRMSDRSTITVSATGTTVRMCWSDEPAA